MHTAAPPALSATFSVIAERFRRAGEPERAVALCREGLAAYPDHLSARVTLGCSLLELGQHLEAHRELQAVLKRAPDNLAAIRGLAELHARGIEEQDAHDMDEDQIAHDLHELQVSRDLAEAPAFAAESVEVAEAAPMIVQAETAPLAFHPEAPAPAMAMTFAAAEPSVAPVDRAVPLAREDVPLTFAAATDSWTMPEPVDLAQMEEVAQPAFAESFSPAALQVLSPLPEPEALEEIAPRILSLDEFDPPVDQVVDVDQVADLAPAARVTDADEHLHRPAALQLLDPLDDFDPPFLVEPAQIAAIETQAPVFLGPAQFEIEDVIDDADDAEQFVDAPASVIDLDLDPVGTVESADVQIPMHAAADLIAGAALSSAAPITVLDGWLTRIHARREEGSGLELAVGSELARSVEAPPTPESASPITVLDGWLTRIQARRSELLSEYAAG